MSGRGGPGGTAMRPARWPGSLWMAVGVFVACATGGLAGPVADAAAQGRWAVTGSLTTARGLHTATLLPSGQVLVAGGRTAANPSPAPSCTTPRPAGGPPPGPSPPAASSHTATLLPSGQVLVAGGQDSAGHPLASAELYDPATGRWAATGALATGPPRPHGDAAALGPGAGRRRLRQRRQSPRQRRAVRPRHRAVDRHRGARHGPLFHTATLLPSGQVLVAGGPGQRRRSPRQRRAVRPRHRAWAATGALATARATRRRCCPPARCWSPAARRQRRSPRQRRALRPGHRAVDRHRGARPRPAIPHGDAPALRPGAGRRGPGQRLQCLASAELYDPATGPVDRHRGARPRPAASTRRRCCPRARCWSPEARTAPSIPRQRRAVRPRDRAVDADRGRSSHGQPLHTATLLPARPGPGGAEPLASRQPAVRPRHGAVDRHGACHTGFNHTATLLPSGQVLVAAGLARRSCHRSRQRRAVRPRDRAVDLHRGAERGRADHTATLLPSGQVLVAGGESGYSDLRERRAVRPGDRAVGADRGALSTAPRPPHRDAPALGPGAGRRRRRACLASASCTTPRPGGGPHRGAERRPREATPRRCCPRARCWSPADSYLPAGCPRERRAVRPGDRAVGADRGH